MNELNFHSNQFTANDKRLEIISELLDEKNFKKKSILDIGCGTGNYFPFFQSLGSEYFTGIDVSKESIEIAKSNFPNSNFILGDFMELSFPNSFDVIFSESTLHYFADPFKGIVLKLYKETSPNGEIILTHGRLTMKSILVNFVRKIGFLVFGIIGESFFLKFGKLLYGKKYSQDFLRERLVYLKELPRLLTKKQIISSLSEAGFEKEKIQIFPIATTSFLQVDHYFIYARK